jgi:hypothetical protein
MAGHSVCADPAPAGLALRIAMIRGAGSSAGGVYPDTLALWEWLAVS